MEDGSCAALTQVQAWAASGCHRVRPPVWSAQTTPAFPSRHRGILQSELPPKKQDRNMEQVSVRTRIRARVRANRMNRTSG